MKEKEKIIKQNKNVRSFLIFVILMTFLIRVVLVSAKLEVKINDNKMIETEDDIHYEYVKD